MKVSVTPSEGTMQGIGPTYTLFSVGFGLCPIALMYIIFPPIRLEDTGFWIVEGLPETERMVSGVYCVRAKLSSKSRRTTLILKLI
jgi:hypothetical protein